MRPLGEQLLLTAGRAVLVAFVCWLLAVAILSYNPSIVCQFSG